MIYLKHMDLDHAGTETVCSWGDDQADEALATYQNFIIADIGSNSVWYLSTSEE